MPKHITTIAIITLTASLSLFAMTYSISEAFAHPGRTASDGCHYCRTNCDKWDVPWNARHCHNPKRHDQQSVPQPQMHTPIKYDQGKDDPNQLLQDMLNIDKP